MTPECGSLRRGLTFTRSRRKPAPKPTAVAKAAPARKPPAVQQAARQKKPAAPEPEIRTAFSTQAPSNGLLSGAQPVMPAGTFNSRWSALR